jgi:hypothetical protein
MLAWCVAGLLAAAVAVAVRWVLGRTDSLGRPRRFPVVSVTLLVVPACAFAVPVWRHARLEDRLGRAATSLVGHRVEVHCQGLGEEFVHAGSELGSVAFDEDGIPDRRTVISRETCGALQDYLDGDRRRPTPEQVIAVHVLTHESRHLAGMLEEARAECEAVQRDAVTARLLGASPADAQRLARLYWAVDYPGMPEAYRSTSCTGGGSWDEHLPDAPWAR